MEILQQNYFKPIPDVFMEHLVFLPYDLACLSKVLLLLKSRFTDLVFSQKP